MRQEKFSCQRDGFTIRGILYRPETTVGKCPAAILSHGFMGNYVTTRKYARDFAERGFISVAFDFCGGGPICRSDGKTTDMSVLTEKEDLKAVIRAVSEMPEVEEKEITLVGFSQGGFVSALVGAELNTAVKRLILFYPALCIPDDARNGKMLFAQFDPANVPETVLCGPMKLGARYVTDVLAMDAMDAIREYRGQVLIVHGTEDDVVRPEYAVRARNAYMEVRGGAPSRDCQLVMIDGANHGFGGPLSKTWDKYVQFAIDRFLEGKQLLFNVDVTLTDHQEEKRPDGKIRARLYFEGSSESPYFHGQVDEPAWDEQICFRHRAETCCADYTLTGADYTGSPCRVRIKNEMPAGGKRDWNLGWKPTVSADSDALAFVNGLECMTYAEMRKKGPFIHIFG